MDKKARKADESAFPASVPRPEGRRKQKCIKDHQKQKPNQPHLRRPFYLTSGRMDERWRRFVERDDARLGSPISRLQEMRMKQQKSLPVYSQVEWTGPPNERVFGTKVKVGDAVFIGRGFTKKAAKTEAAELALKHLAQDQSKGQTTKPKDVDQRVEQTAETLGAMGISYQTEPHMAKNWLQLMESEKAPTQVAACPLCEEKNSAFSEPDALKWHVTHTHRVATARVDYIILLLGDSGTQEDDLDVKTGKAT